MMSGSFSTLHSSRKIPNPNKYSDQVPYEIRRSLELVRTCDQDLQLLISLRNENLLFLEKEPTQLDRVNNIIEAAHKGLSEVSQMVEKCRPKVYGGKVPLRSKLKWLMTDSREFRSLEPVISRQHAAVLTELNYLRQIVLLGHVVDIYEPKETREVSEKSRIFDNITLLGDLMGDMSSTSECFSIPFKMPH